MRAFADLFCRAGGLSKGAGGGGASTTLSSLRETSGYETEGVDGRDRVEQSLQVGARDTWLFATAHGTGKVTVYVCSMAFDFDIAHQRVLETNS